MAFILISFWYDFFMCIIVLYGVFYYWSRKKHSYWKRKGVPGPDPKFLIGNTQGLLTASKQMGMIYYDLYKENKHLPYIGVYQLLQNVLMINDLDMIKTIMVKDFIHFSDHNVEMNFEGDPLTGHLFNLKGEKWKNLRMKLTPTFTTSRMKQMFESVELCSVSMKNYLEKNTGDIMDVKDLIAKFSTDVIGSCAFGIECNSFTNPNSEFVLMGRKVFKTPSMKRILVLMIIFLFPKLLLKLNLKLIEDDIESFFINLVKNTIEYREKNKIVRNDFLQLLIQLRNDELVNDDTDKSDLIPDDGTRLTMMQLAAQVFVFFLAGFETSSTTASFALYELARNPDIQEILLQEIDEILIKHKGKITYDSLGEMSYLTKCIEETLRKYPPLPILSRICTKDYIIPGTEIKIEKDTRVIIPVYGIQRDPEIYPKPDTFDPERFSPENKAARHHFSHLPFGEGPRICIGSRFGMMQTKLGLVTLLSKYKVDVCEKTLIPMEYDKRSFVLASNGGVWLKLVKREI